MSIEIDGLWDHEGWAGRRLPDGTLTASWTAATATFLGYRAQCSCGWIGQADHPPTEAGYDAATDEWVRDHGRPLQARLVPDDLSEEIRRAVGRLEELVAERPVAVLGEARRLARWADRISERAAAKAREDGASEAEMR